MRDTFVKKQLYDWFAYNIYSLPYRRVTRFISNMQIDVQTFATIYRPVTVNHRFLLPSEKNTYKLKIPDLSAKFRRKMFSTFLFKLHKFLE